MSEGSACCCGKGNGMRLLGNGEWLDRVPVLTPGDMRRIEEKAFAAGVPPLLLMEHAAEAVVEALKEALGGTCKGKQVLFLCGTGNNGGDGLAAARLFVQKGGRAEVWLRGQPGTESARTQLAWLRLLPAVSIVDLSALQPDALPFSAGSIPQRHFDAMVDALLGTGLKGAPDALTEQMIDIPVHDFSFSLPPVIAVDIPSGMDGRTGACPGAYVRADVTVTFHAPKIGLFLTRDREAVGQLWVADIGLWDLGDANDVLALDAMELECEALLPRALSLLPGRSLSAHKGDCGRVLVYAGSMGMAGAAAMCAKAAITAGAGLTTIACPRDVMPVLQCLVPGAMCVDIEEAVMKPPAYDVLALGCGLTQKAGVWENILRLFDPSRPTVWDADALNLLSLHPMKLGEKAVMTPHPGEAARLLGIDLEAVLADRFAAAAALSEKFGCSVILKGDVTVIVHRSEAEMNYSLNVLGSPALAKGGSGDALAGILAALLHTDAIDAEALACAWHGLAAMVGEERFGQRELTTDQLIACLHDAEKRGCGQ